MHSYFLKSYSHRIPTNFNMSSSSKLLLLPILFSVRIFNINTFSNEMPSLPLLLVITWANLLLFCFIFPSHLLALQRFMWLATPDGFWSLLLRVMNSCKCFFFSILYLFFRFLAFSFVYSIQFTINRIFNIYLNAFNLK